MSRRHGPASCWIAGAGVCAAPASSLITVAASLAKHREVLNYFRAKKAVFGGVIKLLNNKVKITFRNFYGFRNDKTREIALFHVLGKLPEPEIIHGFF
jgi:hypothetical protein